MKSNSQRGIALVVTLIMLSVVTLMAVVFLAISRHEKASVTLTVDLTSAKLMADAAAARAQAEVISRMFATTNPYNYDFFVSTNFTNPAGFLRGSNGVMNVNYYYPNGTPVTGNDALANMANLWFDPRPPVFVTTNRDARFPPEFRFYLDFNRNGRYDPTGYRRERASSQFASRFATNYYNGDPEWIGVLAHPDQPHGESNYFIGRYAYLVLPAGKSLDVNTLYNNAKAPGDLAFKGYLRNQGVGPWEINLAGFLAGLNTNVWRTYNYRADAAQSFGLAFDDAQAFLRYRGTPLDSAATLFGLGPRVQWAFAKDGIDRYTVGPPLLQPEQVQAPQTVQLASNLPWPGSETLQGYSDSQELFDPLKTSAFFLNHLTNLPPTAGAYDNYTYYRLLSQLGTDSAPADTVRLVQPNFLTAPTNRLNLNYWNGTKNGQTNFLAWTDPTRPDLLTNFFMKAADYMIRGSLALQITNLNKRFSTNFLLGEFAVRNEFCATNIQIYHAPSLNLPFYTTNNEYSPALHRLVQLAANIIDSTTNRALASRVAPFDFPSVFRPIFYKTATNLIVSGYVEVAGTNQLANPWFRPEDLFAAAAVGPLPNVNVYGVPWVVGAKKGFPNFNEFAMDTSVSVGRKLQVRKLALNAKPSLTNQMYVIGISNAFGFEGWNSYTQDFRHALELRISDRFSMGIYDTNLAPGRPYYLSPLLGGTNHVISHILDTNLWSSRLTRDSFRAFTNVYTFLPQVSYHPVAPYFFTASSNSFEASFYMPYWVVAMTNQVQYALVDKSVTPPRVVDFVNLQPLVTVLDVTAQLIGQKASVGNQIGGGTTGGILSPGDFWIPQKVGGGTGNNVPTVGVTNQIGASLGNPVTGEGQWRSWSGNAVSGQDKLRAIDAFRIFMGLRPLNPQLDDRPPPASLVMEAPFTPTKLLNQTVSWQANDPLVHYTVADLTDPVLSSAENLQPNWNIGALNVRYRPWGGNPLKSAPPTRDPATDSTTNFRFKDSAIRTSDDWQFPTNKLANLGLLGRIHRGTPWQTVYLKALYLPRPGSEVQHLRAWLNWAGSLGTHPTNDWKLMDLFTVATDDSSARGLLSVNQTNLAAWSAVLSGVPVLTNAPDTALSARTKPRFASMFIEPPSPQTPQVSAIVDGIIRTRAAMPRGGFEHMGDILATPELTVLSPFLKNVEQQPDGMTDVAIERIPQQILSLLKPDETRIVIYAFGQSLRPADRSVTTSGNYYNLCTNYQITAESVSKVVLRIEPVLNSTNQWRSVVESYKVLPLQ